jgi:hypothetical protein
VNDVHFGVTAKDGKVFTGSGDDVLAIAICTFNDDLYVYLGSGNDAAGIAGTTVKDRFYLYGGSGSDQVVIAPNAGDYIEADNYYLEAIWWCAQTDFGLMAKYATIMTQSGNDSVVLNDLVIERYLNVYLSSGRDDLSVKNTTVNRKAYFNGGSGRDAIHRADNNFKRVSVRRFEIKDSNVL